MGMKYGLYCVGSKRKQRVVDKVECSRMSFSAMKWHGGHQCLTMQPSTQYGSLSHQLTLDSSFMTCSGLAPPPIPPPMDSKWCIACRGDVHVSCMDVVARACNLVIPISDSILGTHGQPVSLPTQYGMSNCAYRYDHEPCHWSNHLNCACA